MVTVVFGLGSALGYALHDFLMVKVVRAAALLTALTWSTGVGFVLLVPLALAVDGVPSGGAEWRAFGFAALSGLCEAAALGCLLRGLVTGNLSIVTPLASLSGAFVAVVTLVAGEPLSARALAGLPLAVAGGLLASIEKAPKEEIFGPDAAPPARPPRRALATSGAGWALLSSVLYAVVVLLLAKAAILGPFTLAAAGRMGTVAVMVPLAALVSGLRPPRGLLRRIVTAGTLDAAAFLAAAVAIVVGPVAIASVTICQGGTMAVLLGYGLLRERLSRVQYVGIACTCVAVVLFALG